MHSSQIIMLHSNIIVLLVLFFPLDKGEEIMITF